MWNARDTVRGYTGFGCSLYSTVNTAYCNVDGYKQVLMCYVFTVMPRVTYTDYFAAQTQSPWLQNSIARNSARDVPLFWLRVTAWESGARICRWNPWATRAPAAETVWWRAHLRAKPLGPIHVTFPFHRGTSPFSKIFSCVIKRRCSHWRERLRHVSVPFRRHCWARMFDVTERFRTGLYLLDSANVNTLCLLHHTSTVGLQRVLPYFAFRNGWKINRIGAEMWGIMWHIK
jgi:hypothetical protein